MKRILMAGVAALAIAAPALAADFPAKGPAIMAPALFNWSGFYIGVDGGYAWGRARLIDVNGYNGPPPSFSYNPEGFQGGLYAGFNWQSGALVAGVEGEFGWLGLNGSRQFPPYVGVRTPFDSVAATRGGWYAALAGRIGVAMNNWLFYAKAGGIWADIRSSFTDTDPIGTTLVAGTSVTGRSGWLGALGTEVGLTPNLIGRIEWSYYNFGTASHTATSAGGFPFTFRHPLTAHSLRVGLAWKM